MPEISVVVPVYRVEQYLKECINSLLEQTFSDIEIILVDDGSPDTCGDICNEYSKKDERIKVIHQENRGLSCARNVGIDASRGNYICFVDSDDYVAPQYCEVLYRLLHNTDYDFSMCGTCRFVDGERPNPKEKSNYSYVLKNTELLKEQLRKHSEFGVWNKLYKKKIFETMRFEPKRVHEDVLWSGNLARELHNGIICTDQQLYYYRQRDGGIVSLQSKKCSPDFIYAGESLIETAKLVCPELEKDCLRYTVEYPWTFVDSIYVQGKFGENREFLKQLQWILRKYAKKYEDLEDFNPILRHRMKIFAYSRKLYGINAYMRLIRVYLFHILKKDPYSDGHGI